MSLLAPPRILFVSCVPVGGATSRYRCEHVAEALADAGVAAPEVVYVGQPRIRVDHDVIVLHRISLGGEGQRLLRAARRCGAVVVYGTDDLVFDDEAARQMAAVWRNVHAGPVARFRLRTLLRHAPRHRAMMAASDAVVASTDYLAQRLRDAGAPVTAHVTTTRNFLNPEIMALSEAAWRRYGPERGVPGHRTTLAYLAGTATHDADLATIAGTLAETLSRYPEVDLLLVGPVRTPTPLAPLESAGRVRRLPFVHWQALPELLAREADVNLMPLDLAHPFNHAKSEIKFLEAAAVRLPTIAAASAAMREAVGAGGAGTGAVLASGERDWAEALSTLLEFPGRRVALGQAAYDHLQRTGTADVHRAGVIAWFRETVCSTKPLRNAAFRPAGTWVNWPTAPPKYAAKALLERIEGRHASLAGSGSR